MSNLLFSGGTISQGTSLGTVFGNHLVTGGSVQSTSQACILDITPPVFSGISFLTLGALGQLQAQWNAATDLSSIIRYEVYVKASSPTGLFNSVNLSMVTTQLQANVFSLGDGTLLQTADTYYVGVRAVDAVGNRDNNIVSLSQISPGITGALNASISGLFNIDDLNQLIATFWVTDSEGVITNPLRLGPASYAIYDKNGNLVPGMSESGIAPDSEGFFEISPVASILDLDNNFYAAKVTILVDGVNLTYNLPIMHSAAGHQYESRAIFSISSSNELQGTLWCTKDSEMMSDGVLGAASYTIYDKNGNSIGITESGILPDVNGYYQISPVNASSILDLTHYVVKITILASGENRIGTVGITLGE
jgi:hypothetical protein